MSRTRILAGFVLTLMLASVAMVALAGQQAGSQPTATGQASGQQAADQTDLTFRSGINFVTVDAYVSDSKGQPITDLKQSDFEIFEDNKPQKIEQFRFIKVDGNPRPGEPPPQEIRNRDDEEREAARDDTRVFVIFLDDYHTRLGSSLAVRQPLSEFIQNQLRPLDLVAIMKPWTEQACGHDETRLAERISQVRVLRPRRTESRPRHLEVPRGMVGGRLGIWSLGFGVWDFLLRVHSAHPGHRADALDGDDVGGRPHIDLILD